MRVGYWSSENPPRWKSAGMRNKEGERITTQYPLRGEAFNKADDPNGALPGFQDSVRRLTQKWPSRDEENEFRREGVRGRSMTERDMKTLEGTNPGWTPGPSGDAQTIMEFLRGILREPGMGVGRP